MKEIIRCEIKQIKDELKIERKLKNSEMVARYKEMLQDAQQRLRAA